MYTLRFRKFMAIIPLLTGIMAFSFNLQAAPTYANASLPDLPAVARGVPMGGALEVFDLKLDQFGNTNLKLERFSVFTPDAKIEVVNGPSVPVPDVAYFRGKFSEDEDSVVMLSVFKNGKIHGVISGKDGVWLLEKKSNTDSLKTRKTKLEKELKNRTFDCDSDKLTATTGGLSPASGASASGLGGSGLPLDIQYSAKMIIDTDYEFWQEFWNLNSGISDNEARAAATAADAVEYLGDIMAFASSMYEREINTNLQITQTRLFADDTDPYSANSNFCGCDGEGKLDEVQDAWSGNATPRTLVHFISGKTEGCGCAYTGGGSGVLCSQGDGYGASSSIGPAYSGGAGFNIDNPGYTWEGMVIAHEIGHNFGSPHTHNYCGEGGNPNAVDICVDDATDSVANCEGDNNRSLPGLGSLTGGSASQRNGTIMSYCHQQSGGFDNIAHTFGEFHPYGIAAYRVPNKMFGNVVNNGAACMDVAYTGGDLRLQKECKPDTPMPAGGTAVCTITVDNLGPNTAQGIKVVDNLLSDGAFTIGAVVATKGSDPMPAGTCTNTPNPQNQSGSVTCNLGLLDSGHKVVIEVPLTATTAQSNISDSAEVSSDSNDPDQFNNTAGDNVQIVASADLRISKSDSADPVIAGGASFTYNISITNDGPSPAENVVVNDQVPSGLKILGVTGSGGASCNIGDNEGNPQPTTCNFGILTSGASRTMTITVQALPGTKGLVSNDASVSSSTLDPDNSNNLDNETTTVNGDADLSVTKTDSADPVIAGGASFTYDITVHNNGPSAAENVVATDQVPDGLKLLAVSGTGGATCNIGDNEGSPQPTTCNFGTLTSGASRTMTITVQALPDTRGLVSNDASVSSTTGDPDNSNNLATENTTVNGQADLQLVKTLTSGVVVAGANIDYKIDVTNNGPSTATNVTVTDTLEAVLTFVSSNPACVNSPEGTLNCAIGSMLPGETKSIFITAKVSSSATGSVNNSATVTGVEFDPNLANNTDDAGAADITTSADLWLDKLQNYSSGNPSGTQIYTLKVYNKPGCEEDDQLTCWNQSGGPSDAQNVVVTDPLPLTSKELIVQFVSPGCSYDQPSHTVTCTVATLVYGQSASFEIQADVKGSKGTFENTGTVSSSTSDPNSANNSDTVKTVIQGSTGKGGGGGRK